MISPIYARRNRGQVVTAACQWMWEHRVLAFKVMLLPILIAEFILLINMLMFKSVLVYVVLAIFAFLFIPVIPCFMFHVVENPDDFGYPENTHGLMRSYSYWWYYFWPILKISFIAGLFDFVLSFTVIVPMIMPFMQLLAIVICQREEDKGISSLVDAFKMIFNSLGTFIMCGISLLIIMVSVLYLPCLMFIFLDYCMKSYMSHDLYKMITSVYEGNQINIYILLISLGIAVSMQIVMVIVQFFYGHCKEIKDHPALIERIEQFS